MTVKELVQNNMLDKFRIFTSNDVENPLLGVVDQVDAINNYGSFTIDAWFTSEDHRNQIVIFIYDYEEVL